MTEKVTSGSSKPCDITHIKSELKIDTKGSGEPQNENTADGLIYPESLEADEGKLLSLDAKGVKFQNQGFPKQGTSCDSNSPSSVYNTTEGKLYFILFLIYLINLP